MYVYAFVCGSISSENRLGYCGVRNIPTSINSKNFNSDIIEPHRGFTKPRRFWSARTGSSCRSTA